MKREPGHLADDLIHIHRLKDEYGGCAWSLQIAGIEYGLYRWEEDATEDAALMRKIVLAVIEEERRIVQ